MSKEFYLAHREGFPVLNFLWKWKVLSTAALREKFFSHYKHYYSAYNWLNKHYKGGYISPRTNDQGRFFLWSLDKRGFRVVQERLPVVLRENGFKSEAHYHDWLVSALHLGEWLTVTPAGVSLFSEQELRRYQPEHFPLGIPKSITHRADGYWNRIHKNNSWTIALEVELNLKSKTDYEQVGKFYGDQVEVSRVLWLVNSLNDVQNIMKGIGRAETEKKNIHSFIILDSFLALGWSALIEHGPGQGLTIQTFLLKSLGFNEDLKTVYSDTNLTVNKLLETRRTVTISDTSGRQ